MKKWALKGLYVVDLLFVPLVYLSAWLLKMVRRAGVYRLPHCRKTLVSIGVFPVRDHYYEPQFKYRNFKIPLSQDRVLPGIDPNTIRQLEILKTFSRADELADISKEKKNELEFYMNNGQFESGDAEYLYQLIRSIKPPRMFEIGSGHSTLMAIKAIRKNCEEDAGYRCKHVCIEPYEMPWLEKAGVVVIRKKVEDVGVAFFSELEKNDILFIDSSHIIRPQGDVVFEVLELLPTLKQGVIVHVHDIFSPRNYLKSWLVDRVRFWNEQYLLEAFLSHNASWKIIGALNYLHHNYYEELQKIAPFITPEREPGSIYIERVA